MIQLLLIIGIVAVSLFTGGWLGRFLTRYPFGRSASTGIEGMKGRVVRITAVKEGFVEVEFESQIWHAIVLNDIPPKIGSKARIMDLKGNKLYVDIILK